MNFGYIGKGISYMKTYELKSAILGGQFDARFTYIYGEAALETQKKIGAKNEAQLKRIAKYKKMLNQAKDELELVFTNEMLN